MRLTRICLRTGSPCKSGFGSRPRRPIASLMKPFPGGLIPWGTGSQGDEAVIEPFGRGTEWRKRCGRSRCRGIALGEQATQLSHGSASVSILGVGRVCTIGPVVQDNPGSIPGDRRHRAKALPGGLPDEHSRFDLQSQNISNLRKTHYSVQKKDFSSPVRVPYCFTFMGLAIGSGKSMMSLR